MRFLEISYVLSKHLVFHRVTQHKEKCFGERFKYVCEELGLTFMKIGQVLSMRYDLLSETDRKPLRVLLDHTNVLPFDQITGILAREYGKSHTAVFNTFNRKPLGSASVSQVHKATLRDGRIVAVKIKRPAVDRYVRTDVRIIKKIVWVAMRFSSTLRNFQALEFVVLFERWMEQDTDFRLEAKNIRKIRDQSLTESAREQHAIECMDTIPELCTDNVIVMDFIDGIPVSRTDDCRSCEGYDVEKSVRAYVNTSVRSWFRDDLEEHLFQADPHFSNIIALPGGRVANIDCGLVSSLTKKEMRVCKDLLLAIFLKDASRIARIATEFGGVDYATYRAALESDIEVYLEKTDDEGLGYWFFEFTKILAKHKLRYPYYLITLGRANLILDGLVEAYIPGHKTLDLLGGQLREHALKEFMRYMEPSELIRTGYRFFQSMRTSSGAFESFVRRMCALGESVHASKEAV